MLISKLSWEIIKKRKFFEEKGRNKEILRQEESSNCLFSVELSVFDGV